MSDETQLHEPWMVAVWPGMGHVATTAGYYLMSKLGMQQIAEWSSPDLFDTQHVEVERGLMRLGRLPLSRLFAWKDPKGAHDIVVFIGEAQPPAGNLAFCRELVGRAKELGVQRIFSFAALATNMQPGQPATVHGAATDGEGVRELERLEVQVLQDGNIGGLNGVLPGVAALSGFRGTCLLGEMPHLFTQLPYPSASLAVLRVFATLASLELDLGELVAQAKHVEQSLGDFLTRAQGALGRARGDDDENDEPTEEAPMRTEPRSKQQDVSLSAEDQAHIERLFESAAKDRAAAYELKRELDRLGVFKRFEDRFLDLFRAP